MATGGEICRGVDMNKEREFCEMCDFMMEGFKHAHSRQARSDYGCSYVEHNMKFHPTRAEDIKLPEVEGKAKAERTK